jgi:hypothetical protein
MKAELKHEILEDLTLAEQHLDKAFRALGRASQKAVPSEPDSWQPDDRGYTAAAAKRAQEHAWKALRTVEGLQEILPVIEQHMDSEGDDSHARAYAARERATVQRVLEDIWNRPEDET